MSKRKSFFGAVNLNALVLAAGLLMGLLTGLLTGCKPKIDPKYNYTVEHLQQNIGNDEYTVYEREILSGKAGETTSAAAKTYEGFTVQDFSQAAINADGSTVVQIKYNRNEITITLDLQGGSTTTPLIDGDKLKGRYGADITLVQPTKDGIIFWHWKPELPSTFPAQNTTYTASWINGYIVTIKGDERTDIPQETFVKVPITETKTWGEIKEEAKAKVRLGSGWDNGDYEFYEWRLDNENGAKLTDGYQIDKHITVYAVTNYAKAKFNIVDNKIKLTADGKGYTGETPKGKIIIPDGITEIEYLTNQNKGAFRDCSGITSVKLPQSLTQIGDYAFSQCTGLTSIDLASCTKLNTIGWAAFSGCAGLTSIDLSSCTKLTTINGYAFSECTGLTSIDLSSCKKLNTIKDSAFSGCTGLTSINLPASLTTIEDTAFSDCTGLTSINLPASLNTIGQYAFTGCTGLITLTVASGNQHYQAVENVLYTKDGLTLVYAAGGLTSVNILNKITAIGQGAFSGCTGLTSIDLSSCTNLKKISLAAFSDCTGLTSINLSSCTNLDTIDFLAFASCKRLTSIDLSPCTKLTTIGREAFKDCEDLKSINLPASLTKIYWAAFSDCDKLTSAVFADPAGWAVYDSIDYSGTSTPINEEELKDPKTAASFLSREYYTKYWKKN
ncbi:leucine-rich repeat domain-containing protein [Treponema sp. OMZ 788]|uniref:leucine-rich repeat domain-containing protein n=1 Tax=Treponema sp. OMZ 788 TaxID=2563664 RepID=UPI0020A5B7E1|nr:leucine-rich repeat domain-containing protein [Treponema sp. OMZ 788]UTC64641.1 leucine-rich repeat domain-containing protein [Treponema sp. OMZ 788]